ncbi:MAG: aspartyl protease family protein [Candidatus Eremiobacteraeota bacterium]|nr:aspartyl protease family protein [Candidatus Eremiobacteraeota bacterium]
MPRIVWALACLALTAQAPAPPPPAAETIGSILTARKIVLRHLGVRDHKRLEASGLLTGLNLQGSFHTWQAGERERSDENLGIRSQTVLRSGEREFIINSSGNVRRLHGLLVRRQRSEDFIESADFLDRPEYSTLVSRVTLPSGAEAFDIAVSPPGGQPLNVDIDAKTLMIDRLAYVDSDALTTIDYSNYKSISGALIPFAEVTSDGNHQYDITQITTDVRVDKPIDESVFAVPKTTQIETDKPITIPIRERRGHLYAAVSLRGRTYDFLIDTGSQGIVVDSRIAGDTLLLPQGSLEVSGARRTGGLGLASLDSVQIGGARLPVKVVSVLDLTSATGGTMEIDGILGYPFFAAAEVRIDPVAMTMTFSRPGMLPPGKEKFDVDVDRELPEVLASVDGTEGRFLIDTGNGNELLIFHRFAQAHPGRIPYAGKSPTSNFGVGGSTQAVSATISELDLGPFRLFNRRGNIMLTDTGAFADQFDAGNIGLPVLRNFTTTFDLANEAMYLERGSNFDDGRYRTVTEP